MFSRRTMLQGATSLGLGLGLGLTLAAGTAQAFTFQPYEDGAVKKAIASGKKVVIHVYAPWCLQCRTQASILKDLEGDKTYDGIAFFRVEYDNQGDVVKALGVPRSTLIGYKGGKETNRMSWGMSKDSVLGVLNSVI